MAGRKVFTSGEILTSADVNSFLMDQSVMVFADSSARSSAIPSPSEGMVTYLKDEDEVTVFDGSAFKAVGPGKILQVVSTTKTDTFSATSATYTDLTGMTATITPSSTLSKILVSFDVSLGQIANTLPAVQLVRSSTAIALGAAAGSRTQATVSRYFGASNPAAFIGVHSMTFLDSPATAGAVTYKLQGRAPTGAFHVNRTDQDANSSDFPRTVSSITLMEVAG